MPSLRVGDEAVRSKTGKTWHEWFDFLSSGSTINMSHQDMAAFLGRQYGLSDWWCQIIVNAFEQHTGKIDQHQKPEGFEISVSKTFRVEVKVLYEYWSSVEKLDSWLQDTRLKVTTSTRNRSLRAQWSDGKSRLSVDFYPKSKDSSQVVVQHARLETLEEAERMQAFWKSQLDRLDKLLEKSHV